MKILDFSIEVPAKWVLSGEHSVLRGKPALAFPYTDVSLKLTYRSGPAGSGLSITNNPFQSQIVQLIERGFIWLKRAPQLNGVLEIHGTIPIGAGLGSSAALCVAISRFVIWNSGIKETDIDQWVSLATHLEDVFHGKSSGLDVNVIALSKPIIYSIKEGMSRGIPEVLPLGKLPRFELYDSGLRGSTRECIEKVKQWNSDHPSQAPLQDEKMGRATDIAISALKRYEINPKDAEQELAAAMKSAQDCFEAWGLVPQELLKQKQDLLEQGALAVKLTGAGLGGFWVALWPSGSFS